MKGKESVRLLMNLAYEWGYYDGAGQENKPYRQRAKARCETLCDQLERLLIPAAPDAAGQHDFDGLMEPDIDSPFDGYP